MTRRNKIEQLVGGYEVFANAPAAFEAEFDVCLLERDEIEDRLVELTAELAERLAQADQKLRDNAQSAFEDAPFDAQFIRDQEDEPPPTERWWWYLDRIAASQPPHAALR